MIDELDRALVHALHLDGRATFSRIASVLGVSTQTVTRRYQRLRGQASLRVVGLADPRVDSALWMLRLTASPHNAGELAHALALRADTRWVQLTSGGTEIVTGMSTPAYEQDHSLLLRDIPRTAGIISVSAQRVVHVYLGGTSFWRGGGSLLTERQQDQLRWSQTRPGLPRRPGPVPSVALTEQDRALLVALGRDGRASHAALAEATDATPATVARRLAELRASGALYFDVEVDHQLFGASTRIVLWMAVPPAHLDQVAHTLASHDELAFLAATTGKTNLIASALVGDPAELHTYLTHRLGAVPEIQTLETVPVLRTLKSFGPVGSAVLRSGRPGSARPVRSVPALPRQSRRA